MAKKQNMFAGFGAAAQEREQEQREITAAVTGTPAPQAQGKKTTMTLSIMEQDKLRVKQYALTHGTTVSDLLHDWIVQHCTD